MSEQQGSARGDAAAGANGANSAPPAAAAPPAAGTSGGKKRKREAAALPPPVDPYAPVLGSTAPVHVPLFSPQILGPQPLDDVTRLLCDFLFSNARRPNLELEAKIGMVIDKEENERIKGILPVASECVLSQIEPLFYRFESNVPAHVFDSIRDRLTDIEGATTLSYVENDSFYPAGVRVSKRVVNGREEVRAMKKGRKMHLNFFAPSAQVDFRVSACEETPVATWSGEPWQERRKERTSVAYSFWQFDITEVTTRDFTQPHPTPVVTREVELELTSAGVDFLREQVRLAGAGRPHRLTELGRALLANCRLLAAVGSAGVSTHNQLE